MVKLDITAEAKRDFCQVPHGMQDRILGVFQRLARWPVVSGAKPLRGQLKGCFRVRAGDWRVLFRVQGQTVVVFRIDNRRDVYQR